MQAVFFPGGGAGWKTGVVATKQDDVCLLCGLVLHS